MLLLLDIFLSILHFSFVFYLIILIAAAIFQMVGANSTNSVVVFCSFATKPPRQYLLKKFPKLLLQTEHGYSDLSGLVLGLGLGMMIIIIEKIQMYFNLF